MHTEGKVRPPRHCTFLILVTFVDNYARDDILTRGPSLSGYRDDDGRPTAGIRLDIPAHLIGCFKTLEAFGFKLKKKHGQQLKKHIKFDEFENLYIQVGLKQEDKDVDWQQYTPEEAKDGLKKLQAKGGPRFNLLASPEKGDSTAEASGNDKRRKIAAKGSTNSSWAPPARTKNQGQDWRPPARDPAFEDDEDIAD